MTDKELEKIHKALANRRRIAIVRYLNGEKDANLGDIAEHLRLSYKSTSKHLSQLVAAEVLEKESRSGFTFFRLSYPLPPIARLTISLL
ncbi:MAG TPA: winged helix-turn-helix domain-containing protein [Candidatus Paceibacterota bacterium]|nr:winged helix-turn-helix domain-containing protein [Candidatus Paceibacterota bacterium]